MPSSVNHAVSFASLAASLVLAMGLSVFALSVNAGTHAQTDGQVAYTEAGCARCHSVDVADIEATVAERMRGPDLGTVGTDHDAAWVVAVLQQETELDSGPHRARFRGSDDQLRAVADWLVGLKLE